MNRSQVSIACMALSLSALAMLDARAGDPAEQVDAAKPAVAAAPSAEPPADPQKPEEVLKTKTRSNQSNDRVATPAPAKDEGEAEQPEALLKSKTKSNQSND